jgi:hypothetical protein
MAVSDGVSENDGAGFWRRACVRQLCASPRRPNDKHVKQRMPCSESLLPTRHITGFTRLFARARHVHDRRDHRFGEAVNSLPERVALCRRASGDAHECLHGRSVGRLRHERVTERQRRHHRLRARMGTDARSVKLLTAAAMTVRDEPLSVWSLTMR